MSYQPQSILQDLISFLKYPDRNITRLPMGIETFFRLVGVHYIFLIGAIIAMTGVSYLINLDDLDHSIQDMLNEASPIQFLLMLAVVAPVLEEIIFRFPLRFRRGSLFLALCIFTLFVYLVGSAYLAPKHDLYPAEVMQELESVGFIPNISAIFLATGVFLLGMFGLFLATLNNRMLDGIGKTVDRLFPYIFYATAMIFGYVHFTNFSGDMKWFWIPFLIIPQFVMGLVMGYSRLRFGMLSNIMLHAVNNLIPGLVILATAGMGGE